MGVSEFVVLIDESLRVTNDVQLGGDLRLLLVSGSNMSGKSTMLRTIGGEWGGENGGEWGQSNRKNRRGGSD